MQEPGTAADASTPNQTLSIAIVIPTLNEEMTIGRCLESLGRQTVSPDAVLVADGGSTDKTCSKAENRARVLNCPSRGRGNQIADAVRHVSEDVVLIGHADMIFPPRALERIHNWMVQHPNCPGGCLGHRFDARNWLSRCVEWWDGLRARRRKISFGDQAQFFRRSTLERAGGFPAQPLMEDMELAKRLLSLGEPAYLDVPVTVSARRLNRLGYLRSAWVNYLLRREYKRSGVESCQQLYDRYYQRT